MWKLGFRWTGSSWVWLQSYQHSVQSDSHSSGSSNRQETQVVSSSKQVFSLERHLFPWKNVCLTLVDWNGCVRQTQPVTQPKVGRGCTIGGSFPVSLWPPQMAMGAWPELAPRLNYLAWHPSRISYTHGLPSTHSAPSKWCDLGQVISPLTLLSTK